MILLHFIKSPTKSAGLCNIHAEHLLSMPITFESLPHSWTDLTVYDDDVQSVFITVIITSSLIDFKCTFFICMSTLLLLMYKVLSLLGIHFIVILFNFVSKFSMLLRILALIPYAHVLTDLGTYWKSFTFSYLEVRLRILLKLRIIAISTKLV